MPETTGQDFLFGVSGGQLIGGATGVTSEVNANQIDIIEKAGGAAGRWNRRLAGLKGHTHSVDFNYLQDGENIIGRENALVEYDVGGTFTEIPGVTDVSLSMEMSVEPVGGIDKARWAFFIPNRKDISLSLSLNYNDPYAAGFSQDLQDALENDNTLTLRLSIGDFQVTGDVKVSDYSISTEADAIIPLSVEMASQGVWTKTDGTGLDNGLSALLDTFFAADPAPLDFISGRLDDAGNQLESTRAYEGNGFATSLEISIPDEEEITASAEVTGTGPLTFNDEDPA